MNEIRLAFAVNGQGGFEKRHFGDSDKFLIYELHEGKVVSVNAEENIFKDIDETHSHGSKKKGQEIVKFLKNKGVKALVSKQFGRNIKMINQHFVPVITNAENVDEVLIYLPEHLDVIISYITQKPESYKLVDLRKKNNET